MLSQFYNFAFIELIDKIRGFNFVIADIAAVSEKIAQIFFIGGVNYIFIKIKIRTESFIEIRGFFIVDIIDYKRSVYFGYSLASNGRACFNIIQIIVKFD